MLPILRDLVDALRASLLEVDRREIGDNGGESAEAVHVREGLKNILLELLMDSC